VSLTNILAADRALLQDHADFVKAFYEHCFEHRFLLGQEDKKDLTEIFSTIQASTLYGTHLDLHKDVLRKDL